VAHKWKIDGDFASGDATFALAYNVANKGAVSSFQVGGGAMHTEWRGCAMHTGWRGCAMHAGWRGCAMHTWWR